MAHIVDDPPERPAVADFKDHFSVAAHEYDRFRPDCPAEPRPVRWPLHLRVGRIA